MVTHGIGTVISSCRNCGHQGELSEFLFGRIEREDKKIVWCESCRFLPAAKVVRETRAKYNLGKEVHCCEVCTKVFHSKAHLNRHQIVHSGVKAYLCEVCGHSFSQKSSLWLHVRSHVGLNPYKCKQCGRAFRFKASLHSHILNLHWSNTSSEALISENIYRCHQCEKRFATAYKLGRHYRMHTGECPYACDQCGHLFSQRRNLKLHMKMHNSSSCPVDPGRKQTCSGDSLATSSVPRESSMVEYMSPPVGKASPSVQPNSTQYIRESTKILVGTHATKCIVQTLLKEPADISERVDATDSPTITIDSVLHSEDSNSKQTNQFVLLSSIVSVENNSLCS